jgi:hypothetical protein
MIIQKSSAIKPLPPVRAQVLTLEKRLPCHFWLSKRRSWRAPKKRRAPGQGSDVLLTIIKINHLESLIAR